MYLQLIKDAVPNRKVLAFEYDGKARLVEPHAVGNNKKGEAVLRGFQFTGDSATSASAWKLFTISKIDALTVLDMISHAPRPGYKADDKAMTEIFAQLKEAA
jgi:predicted DNA-binding transcriptional regulator YafY